MDKFINTQLLNVPNFMLVMFSMIIVTLLIHVFVVNAQ